jgi:hypothetical protein
MQMHFLYGLLLIVIIMHYILQVHWNRTKHVYASISFRLEQGRVRNALLRVGIGAAAVVTADVWCIGG